MKAPTFDVAAAHAWFAAHCFDEAWTLIRKHDRSAADDEAMIRSSQASMWHWSMRPECTDRHRSIGCWQLSRVHALAGRADDAARHANACLAFSETLAPFYRAYAHEALARAAWIASDVATARDHIERARALAGEVEDAEERGWILDDLATIARA